jgi:hypothetical protein
LRCRLQHKPPLFSASSAAVDQQLDLQPRTTTPDFHACWQHPDALPEAVAASPAALRLLTLLGPLDWTHLPERNLLRNWGHTTVPHTAFILACLIKLNEGISSMGKLRRFLVENPTLVWLCGFRPVTAAQCGALPLDFDADAALPTQRHLTRMLRELPNSLLQYLLTDSVRLIQAELARLQVTVDEVVAVDTKHVIAWVKENNRKAYVPNRYDKSQQPAGDPDCKLGCKRQHNKTVRQPALAPPTPNSNPVPAASIKFGEFYWGYGSGLAVVPVPGYGDYILAELTQPFDQSDVSYFFPLMQQVEQRLGHKPRFGALDAAFDAWYVHAYFHNPDDPGAFAAVPFAEKGGYKAGERRFSPEGLPLCAAGLPMPQQLTFTDRTVTLLVHERAKYACPLLFPAATGQPCPIQHSNFAKKGCTAQMPTSIGARLRYSLDRHSDHFKRIYSQRTAVERINSQAVALGIERPHIRNGQAVANLNSLTYLLINLRFLQRLRTRTA